MPKLTGKGRKIKTALKSQYGSKKGIEIFHKMKNAGKIKGVDRGFFGHYDVPMTKKDMWFR